MKNRFFAALIAILTVLAIPATYASPTPTPGGACSNAGYGAFGGGTNLLVCDGAAWQIVLDYGQSGEVLFRLADDTATCGASLAGRIRFSSSASRFEGCDGANWGAFGGVGGGGDSGIWSAASTGMLYGNTGTPTLTDIPGMSLTFDLSETTTLLLLAEGGIRAETSNAAATQSGFAFVVDGTRQGDVQWGDGIQGVSSSAEFHATWIISRVVTLAAGSHTVKVQASPVSDLRVCSEGGGTIQDYKKCRLTIIAGGPGNGSGSPLWTAGTGDDIYFNSGSGNVGIGTTNPAHYLHVNQSTVDRAAVRVTGGDTAGTTLNTWITDSASNPLLTIYNGGNVGIGTGSPGTKLHVHGPSSILRLEDADATAGSGAQQSLVQHYANGSIIGQVGFNTGAATMGVVQYQDAPLVFQTNGATRVHIAGNGNVGLGTTSPGQKLTVAGTVESTSGGIKFPDGTTQTSAAALPTTCSIGEPLSWNGSAWVCADQLILVGGKSFSDCKVVGTPVDIGGGNFICQVSVASEQEGCPAGWAQYQDWSETISRFINPGCGASCTTTAVPWDNSVKAACECAAAGVCGPCSAVADNPAIRKRGCI